MLPEGFYHGKGPWWLIGWEGKHFDHATQRGYNMFRGRKALTFIYFEENGKVRIVYDSIMVPFEDVMVPDGDGWKGTIYIGRVKVGTFELRR